MPLHKALLALWLAASSGAKRAENVVMLLADDLGWADVSVPPHKKAALWVTETPNLERMAREGLTLTGYRNAASVCSPSRLAIATGVFPWRYRLSGLLKDGFRGLPRAPTTARSLQSAGFATAHFGKWHLGGVSEGARADRAAGRCHRGAGPPGPLEHGYDLHLDQVEASIRDPPVCCSCCAPNPWDNATHVDPEYRDPTTGRRTCRMCGNMYSRQSAWWHEFRPGHMKPVPKAMDLTKRTADEAVAWIRRQKQRFFADVWFNAPHLPVEPIAPFFDSQRAPRDRAGRVFRWPGGDVVKYSPEYDSVVRALDAGVGSIINELDGSTLAVFTSDNGPEEGVGHARPFRGRKRSPYEGGTAVPCIFWMPGTIPANKREAVFVNGADFHATFLSAAQVAYPEEGRAWPPLQPSWDPAGRDVPGARLFDGVDHWPTLTGDDSRRQIAHERVAAWVTQRGHGIVRTEGLKYIDFLKVQSKRTKPALYNLTLDPYERNDISEKLAEALPRLQGLVDAFLAAPPRDYSKGDCVQEGGSCEGSATPYAPFPHMPVCMHAAPPPRRKGHHPWNLKLKGGKEF